MFYYCSFIINRILLTGEINTAKPLYSEHLRLLKMRPLQGGEFWTFLKKKSS